MKKEIKNLWTKALRSGKYKQTRGALRDSTGYCCLGVLCDLYSKEIGTPWDGEYFLSSSSVVPYPVRVWAGLRCGNPTVKYTEELNQEVYTDNFFSLASLNDGVELNFSQIADIIEEQF
jgi:hypothetical protein